MVISTKRRTDKCAYNFAFVYSHPKKQVIASIIETKPPQKCLVSSMAQFPEKCWGDSFLHPWRESPADTMKYFWLLARAALEILIAYRNKLLKIIRYRGGQ